MAEETQKNTVATVGMRFSIIGLIALVTVFLAGLGFPLLFIGFILGIIGLFYKPRGRARVAVCIPLVVFIAIFSVIAYVWNSVKTPATQFGDWATTQLEQLDEENFDNDRFSNIANEEFNNIFSSLNEEDFKLLMENSEGSNTLEKGSYAFFSLLQQGFETALDRYNNELPEIDEENEDIIDDENIDNEEDINEEVEENENTEQVVEEEDEEKDDDQENENTETFSQNEKNDIEEILDILE